METTTFTVAGRRNTTTLSRAVVYVHLHSEQKSLPFPLFKHLIKLPTQMKCNLKNSLIMGVFL